MTIGIYALEFCGTSKVYIGLSVNIYKRFKDHKTSFYSGQTSFKLLEAYKIHGMPTLKILIECDVEELEDLEIEAIDVYDSINNGFNSVTGGSLGCGMVGDTNGRSRYSNEDIEAAFQLLTGSENLTYNIIGKRTGVSTAVISNIKSGKSHTWLKGKFPIQYVKLISMEDGRANANVLSVINRSAKALGITYPQIIDPLGNIYQIDCLTHFAKNNGLAPSALHRVLSGKASHHKGWKVYNGSI